MQKPGVGKIYIHCPSSSLCTCYKSFCAERILYCCNLCCKLRSHSSRLGSPSFGILFSNSDALYNILPFFPDYNLQSYIFVKSAAGFLALAEKEDDDDVVVAVVVVVVLLSSSSCDKTRWNNSINWGFCNNACAAVLMSSPDVIFCRFYIATKLFLTQLSIINIYFFLIRWILI